MRHGSLFSGIGGFDLAAEWMGWQNIFSCEKDDKANLVLQKNFPDTRHHRDIFNLDGKEYRGKVDIITGGFPCQPFSVAGKRQGESDDRFLWPQMLRVIGEVKPKFVVGENVAGITTMENGRTLERILSDLENEGYTIEVFNIEASSVGAWHRRARVWILAYFNKNGQWENDAFAEKQQRRPQERMAKRHVINAKNNSLHTNYRKERRKRRKHEPIPKLKGIQRGKDGRIYADIEGRPYLSTPVLCGSNDGVPRRMERTGQYGNAVVPQLVYKIFQAIQVLHLEME